MHSPRFVMRLAIPDSGGCAPPHGRCPPFDVMLRASPLWCRSAKSYLPAHSVRGFGLAGSFSGRGFDCRFRVWNRGRAFPAERSENGLVIS